MDKMQSEELRRRFESVLERIESAKRRSSFAAKDVLLVAVSKRKSAELMTAFERMALEKGHIPVFGENYVQEFKAKKPYLSQESKCHLIGHLQKNKAKDAVRLFDVIESLDSYGLAKVVDAHAGKIGKIQEVYLQVNISGDEAKHGFMRNEVREVLPQLLSFNNIKITGLMTITKLYENAEDAREDFKAMRLLRDELLRCTRIADIISELKLSMGMSADFEIAIEEGASVVRIGTALFGPRE